MALAETANLIVNLQLKGGFSRALAKESRALGKFDATLDRTESRAFRAGQQIGTGIRRGAALAAGGLAILAGNVVAGLDSLVELEKQQKQTEAAIKSTGRSAGVTAQHIRTLAERYEALNATVGDEVIQETENLLLSFTNIRNKAFEPALQAILDINTRLGRGPEGLAGTARQVGKALNDPLKGLSALTRIGITFDKKQTARIKKLAKEGKLYQAQGIILKELSKRFGGAFAAEGQTTAGRVAKFRDSIEDLQRTLASGLLPVVSNVADALTELFQDPEVQRGVAAFGKDLAALFTKDRIKSAIASIKDIAAVIGPAFRTAATAVGLVTSAINKLPPDIRNLLIGAIAVNKLTGGLVTNVAGGLAGAIGSALKTIVAGNVTVIGKSVVSPGGGVPGVPAAAKGGGVAGTLKSVAKVTIAGAIVAAAVPIGKAFANALPASLKGPGGEGMSESQRRITEARDAINQRIPEATAAINKMKSSTDEKLIGTTNSIQRMKDALGADVDATKSQVQASGVVVAGATRSSAMANAASTNAATYGAAAAIVSAIYAARPVVNVTNVTKQTTIQNRYGPASGSANQDHMGWQGD